MKIYGGLALNELLKKKKYPIYGRSEFPDYDVFSPNAWVHARELAKRIGADLAIVDKRRNKPGEVSEMTVIGNVKGRRCIIVDDICDTAGTLCKAAETLMGEGAIEVHSYITHGVLSGPAIERISNSVMKHLVITDSIEVSPEAAACKKIRTVPLAPMLAQATLNIANGTSVSSLFDEDTLGPLYQGTY